MITIHILENVHPTINGTFYQLSDTPQAIMEKADELLKGGNGVVALPPLQGEPFMLRVLRRIRDGEFSKDGVGFFFGEDGPPYFPTSDGDFSTPFPPCARDWFNYRAGELF